MFLQSAIGESIPIGSTGAGAAPRSIKGSSGSGASSSLTALEVNPQYESWMAVDQLLLGWLYNSMTPEVAIQVMGCECAKDLWTSIPQLFGVQSRVEEDYLRHVFQTTRKGNLKMEEYLQTMKMNTDNLEQAGSPMPPRTLVSQVLLGLDEEYNAIVAMIQGRVDMSWLDMQSELLLYERRLEHQSNQKTTVGFNQISNASVNMTNTRHVNQNNKTNSSNQSIGGGQRGGGGHGRGRGRGRNNKKPVCQVCGKVGHIAFYCFNRYSRDFVPNSPQNKVEPFPNNQTKNTQPHPTALAIAYGSNPFLTRQENMTDANWYDSGASNHVTSDFNNLGNPIEYSGQAYETNGNKGNA
ncbi:uncharacterized protein LOC120091275 isoform X4 [Benincasa hispida]|uniref:uncharacterized protein LOC120091275 isoform X4 n=1 Tax=Benincasa hispida TaxID=102211 RepID=UPI0018FF2EAC|nr:uncharacterized protein LOC120091275 isoform X4 [Benincasa hispida]